MTRWPAWRLLVWIEVWLLAVAGVHRTRPIHDAFIVSLLIALVPAVLVFGMWAFSRGATSLRPSGDERASPVEVAIAAIAAVAAAGWIVKWTLEARADLGRIDAMLGKATLIIDVSLTWLSLGACAAALTLDWLLAAVHAPLREAMRVLRRTHVTVTAVHVAALFGSAWVFTSGPDPGTVDNAAFFERARLALHVYEYARATIFPVQAFFAAMVLAVAVADTRVGGGE